MIQTLILTMIISLSMLFMTMTHPLSMGLMLLVQAIMTALIIGLVNKTFWFSYVLFLVFVGGMLVMFIYVTSLASNEMFSMPKKTITLMITFMTLTMILMMSTDNLYLYVPMMNNEMNSMDILNNFSKENTLILTKLYNFPHNMITIMMIMYLLITLIVTVKITKKEEGPLRTMN